MPPTKHAAVYLHADFCICSKLLNIALATCAALHCWLGAMAGSNMNGLFSFQRHGYNLQGSGINELKTFYGIY